MGELRVLIVGAGITGLVIAQGLKKTGIDCQIFEAQSAPYRTRIRDWGIGFHWAIPYLEQCLPPAVFSRLQATQVDPFFEHPRHDVLQCLNGETGVLIRAIPLEHFVRLSRKKISALCEEGLEIRYGKVLKTVSFNTDQGVTVAFEDGATATGSNLVGADGARSLLRTILLGQEKSAIQPTPYLMTNLATKYTAEQALYVRSPHPIMAYSIHPDGIFSWQSILENPDPHKPESWTFQILNTWKDNRDPQQITQPEMLAELKQMATKIADPFKSAIQWIPEGTPVPLTRLYSWEPIPWDNRGGMMTLAGDAAHTMTFHRGQGFQLCIADAADFVAAMKTVASGEHSLVDAIAKYDSETIQRGAQEVRTANQISEATHNWELLSQSPLFKDGFKKKV